MKTQDISQTAQKKWILIIEDDPVHRRLMESELQQRYALDFAADSEGALTHLEGDQFPTYDLVVVDLRLPERAGEPAKTEEGFRILRALQKECVCIPIVFVILDNLVDRIRKQIEALKVRRIFEKPFSLREFREAIDTLLSGVEDKERLMKIC